MKHFASVIYCKTIKLSAYGIDVEDGRLRMSLDEMFAEYCLSFICQSRSSVNCRLNIFLNVFARYNAVLLDLVAYPSNYHCIPKMLSQRMVCRIIRCYLRGHNVVSVVLANGNDQVGTKFLYNYLSTKHFNS